MSETKKKKYRFLPREGVLIQADTHLEALEKFKKLKEEKKAKKQEKNLKNDNNK